MFFPCLCHFHLSLILKQSIDKRSSSRSSASDDYQYAYQQKDYATAISYYNQMLEGFSGNAKTPAAELHKGYALLATDKKQAGIDELRELIRRHPQTPEASTARKKLIGMGVRTTAAH